MNRYQHTFPALGTEAFITVVGEIGSSSAEELFNDIRATVMAFERRFSRFVAESELNELNHKAGKWVNASLQMIDLLKLCKEMFFASNGLFNPLILPALQRAGYIGSWTSDVSVGSEGTDYRSRKTSSPAEIEITDNKVKLPKDTAIDLGGIGKGYLLDLLSSSLEKLQLKGYWLSLGGDILASGSDLDRIGWNIGIASARGNGTVASYETNDSLVALATSGVTKRKGKHNDVSWHHIIDPKKDIPAETNVLTASVVADRGYKADVFAKCLVIGGVTVAEDFFEREMLAAFLLQNEGSDTSLDIRKGAFV